MADYYAVHVDRYNCCFEVISLLLLFYILREYLGDLGATRK